ncbi:MAG: hypothetical protein ACI8UO_004990 [Verrucomicrobiales bacterium]|jgi:hypothetical protein
MVDLDVGRIFRRSGESRSRLSQNLCKRMWTSVLRHEIALNFPN